MSIQIGMSRRKGEVHWSYHKRGMTQSLRLHLLSDTAQILKCNFSSCFYLFFFCVRYKQRYLPHAISPLTSADHAFGITGFQQNAAAFPGVTMAVPILSNKAKAQTLANVLFCSFLWESSNKP
mmetsp:Transcript_70675/g.134547  ORF Transcript_70675/g.134547 Transcript_70675/m.134547 type:complete len:123 (-) Transcript_70675:15-383(-)